MNALIRSMLSRANPARVVRPRALWLLLAAALVAAVGASACDLVGDDEDAQQQAQQQQAEPEAAAATAPATTATAAAQAEAEEPSGPTPPPESSATSGAGADAYRVIFPSMALVDVGNGQTQLPGYAPLLVTALVSADGYVLTDLSALAGAAVAAVILSDGTMIADVPLAGADQLTGIAYLGPLERGIVGRLPGAVLGDGERLPPGAPVYAVGFTPESMAGDAPIIISGVFSGLREWTPGQRTLLMTDASFGQEQPMLGSVLVDANGVVIGFGTVDTGWRGHYVSTGDLARSLAQAPPMGVSAAVWLPDPASAATEHLVVVSTPTMMGELALADEATGEPLTLSIGADVAGVLTLIDAEGKILQQSNLTVGATIVTLRPNTVGPYRLTLAPAPPDEAMMEEEMSAEPEAMAEDGEAMEEEAVAEEYEAMPDPDHTMPPPLEVSFSVSSNIPLMTLIDQDDLQALVVGEPLVAGVDAPGDLDRFELPVLAGEVYEVRAQSLTLDMVVSAMGAGTDGFDDDSGGGYSGSDALLMLAPAEDGIIELFVSDFGGWTTGAYVLTVTRTVSVEGSGAAAAMEAEDGDEGRSAVMMIKPAALPTPTADLSLRGVISEDGLVPTLQGIGSAIDENGALIVADEDGFFEIVASIIGPDYSTARLFVMDADGEIVISGRVVANCATPEPCLASAVYIAGEGAQPTPGMWRVLLQPEGAGSGITEWQIEIHLYADAPAAEAEAEEPMEAEENSEMSEQE